MIHVSPYVFAVVFALSSGALALWVGVRFPNIAPESLRGIIVHAVLAMVAIEAAAKLLGGAGAEIARLGLLFAVMLPALVYLFVVCVWTMRHLGNAAQGSVR